MGLNSVFARRLYVCWLLKNEQRPNVPKLMVLTGWPRRTLQDVLKALPGMGVDPPSRATSGTPMGIL